jgi:hypothetical protein
MAARVCDAILIQLRMTMSSPLPGEGGIDA